MGQTNERILRRVPMCMDNFILMDANGLMWDILVDLVWDKRMRRLARTNVPNMNIA
jgi:hypothetical protein